MNTKRSFAIALLGSAGLVAVQAAVAQTTLTMSSWVSPAHHLSSVVLQGFGDEVEKASGGRLKFQIVLQWDLGDPNLKKSDVIRRSIERSLKKTVLGNVGNILESTLKRIGDGGLDASKDDLQGALKKVKELFR